jgi:Platelet-activating factor acetylhydrolase, isoform II
LRRFELFLIFAEAFAVAWAAVFGVRTRRGIVAALLLALFVVHWQVEGLRWQMIPVYGTALGLAIGDILAVERRLDWTRRIARGIFGLAGLALGAILPLVLPVPELPVPTGPEPIGTVTLQLTDSEREEVYGPSPGPGRRLMAQVWYPALDQGEVDPVLWSEDWDIVAPGVSTLMGFPGWFLSHTKYSWSHGASSIPIAPGTFPVVIYSHGWTGFRTNSVHQIESLVSNGFIVVAIDHTYGAVATRFPDDEVVEYDPAAIPDPAEVGEELYAEAIEQLVDVFSQDIVTVANSLEAGPNGPFGALADSVDLTRLGVYGNETGGGAAVQFCLEDERCDAVLGLDPWVEPIPDRVLAISAARPALYMRSDDWRGTDNDAILRGIAERSTSTSYWIGVEGTAETDFVGMPLLSPLGARFGWKGPIPAGRIIPIIDRYLVGFFDVYLLDTGSAALDTSAFEEVSLEVILPD